MSNELLEKYGRHWFGNNRHLCDVLEDMRKCDKTRNYSLLRGLIEEAQVMGNRMEAALSDQKDLIKLQKQFSEMRKERKRLEAQIEKLQEKSDNLSKKSE